jgi:AcrR family transcriptional regulator
VAAVELDTPERLLDAAEQLIAEQGVNAVSLRAVNQAAGANVAAVHYHFGTKVELVSAALERRMSALAEERFDLLAPIEHDEAPDLRRVVEVLALPFVRFARRAEGRAWAGLLAALSHAGPPWSHLSSAAFTPQWVRIEPVLRRALPQLSAAQLAFRTAAAGAILLGPALAPGVDEAAIVDVLTGLFGAATSPDLRTATKRGRRT